MAAADVEAINQVREGEVTALATEMIDGLSAVYTDDVVFMAPNEPAVMGLQAGQEWFAGLIEQFTVTLEYTGSDVSFAGDWAIERYTGTATFTPKAEGEPLTETIKGIHIYSRQADGSWLIAQDIWNTDVPLSADEPM
jgi:ketosteroid isomerase-like protein